MALVRIRMHEWLDIDNEPRNYRMCKFLPLYSYSYGIERWEC